MPSSIIKISVRNLIEFVLKSGNIDSNYIGQKRALEGTKIHQKVQLIREKEAKLNNAIYEREFTLKFCFNHEEFEFFLQGRADGILITNNKIVIEEIKSTYRNLENIEVDKNHLHLAQVKIYAYIYSKIYDIKNISTQLTYYNVETKEMISFFEDFNNKELSIFFNNIINQYYIFAKYNYSRIIDRNKTGEALKFPYEKYRIGQRNLAVSVYKTISENKKLFAQAPTGIGKTISTLFPSIKSLTTNKIEKIFYLTAKTITRQVVEEAFLLMEKRGLKIRVVTFTAKDKICFLEERSCNPEDCIYAKGHFDRLNNALIDILENETIITRSIIENYSKKHMVCPFEFSFDISDFCDCIICDYNYVYDPKVYLKRYFGEGVKNKFVLLNDEAHNLVDRSREMYSAVLNKKEILFLRKILGRENIKMYKSLTNINEMILNISSNIIKDEFLILKNQNEDLNFILYDFIRVADKWLIDNKNSSEHNLVLDLYFKITDFLKITDFFDERYIFFVERTWNDIIIKLLCLDPSYLIDNISKSVVSSIYFSATLSPLNYFATVLGGKKEDYYLILNSPFPNENLNLIIDSKISTKYLNRENSYSEISSRIKTFVNSKTGNYMIFFPSYEYLLNVYNLFALENFDLNILLQEKNLTEKEREDFLNNFTDNPKKSLVAFVVMGGIFSEGIDLVGNRLIGACIVSVGIPLITKERNIIKDYYNENLNYGYNYAYKFPGFNKVLQSAGRVIRSETDTGVVLLIDTRFNSYDYKNLFPKEWSNYYIINNNNQLENILNNFWDKKTDNPN